MRIINPQLAIDHQVVIKAHIFSHQGQVTQGQAELNSLDLSEFGILLQPQDFDLERATKWSKKSLEEYRSEVVVLSGLWRSIRVRLRNKEWELKVRELLHQEK